MITTILIWTVLTVVGAFLVLLVAGIKYLGPLSSMNDIDEIAGKKISAFKRDYILPTHTAIWIAVDLLFISSITRKTSELERFLDWMGQPD